MQQARAARLKLTAVRKIRAGQQYPSGPAQLGGFLPFPILPARHAQILKAVIYYVEA
jgi:hypothetical protein